MLKNKIIHDVINKIPPIGVIGLRKYKENPNIFFILKLDFF